MGDGELVADPHDRADGGAHAGQFRMLEHGLGQQRASPRSAPTAGRTRPRDAVAYSLSASRMRFDRDRGRDVTAGVTAHPVGDDEQVVPGIAGVLVVGADLADVRNRSDGPVSMDATPYRRSSKVVVPILIGVSTGTGVGTVTRLPSRKVPFVESRSWIIHSSFQSRRRAWWVEV